MKVQIQQETNEARKQELIRQYEAMPLYESTEVELKGVSVHLVVEQPPAVTSRSDASTQ